MRAISEPCHCCGGTVFWVRGQDPICQACHPDPRAPGAAADLAARLLWAPGPDWKRNAPVTKRLAGVRYDDVPDASSP